MKATWNNLSATEKRAFGDRWITHDSNLNAWNKPFNELSKLKQQRVSSHIEEFVKVKEHCIR